jgi:hypothetical protein
VTVTIHWHPSPCARGPGRRRLPPRAAATAGGRGAAAARALSGRLAESEPQAEDIAPELQVAVTSTMIMMIGKSHWQLPVKALLRLSSFRRRI